MADEHSHTVTEGIHDELAQGTHPEPAEGMHPELAEGTHPELAGGLTFCINHPNVETGLHCNRCGDPICVRCAVRTPVGYRCPNCIKQQQAIFFTGLPLDYIIAAVVSLPVAAAGAYIVSYLGFFFSIFVSPAAGALTADLASRAVGRRRSRYLWLVVCGSIVIATLGIALYQAGAFSGHSVTGSDFLRLDLGIYFFLALSAAYSRLNLGLRIR